MKVASAVVAMDGLALYWLTWLRAWKPGMSGEEFTQALVARFDTRFKGSRFEWLSGRQSGGLRVAVYPIGEPGARSV